MGVCLSDSDAGASGAIVGELVDSSLSEDIPVDKAELEQLLLAKEIEAARLEAEELRRQVELKEKLPHLYGFKHYKWSRKFFESRNKENLLTCANQVGKALQVDEEIPTVCGFKKMRDIKVGDFVFDRNGKPTEVIDIPYIGDDESYRFYFNDKSSVTVSGKHDWICMGPRQRFRKKYTKSCGTNNSFENKEYRQWVVRSSEDIIAHGGYSPETKPTKKYVIPMSKPVEMPGIELFDPYYVGVFIGNGSGSGRNISLHDDDSDIISVCEKYGNRYKTSRAVVGIKIETLDKLLKLGLCVPSYLKFIPEEYLRGSIEQRRALLAGLMDTDGTVNKKGTTYSYSTTSETLANDVKQLACSLGGLAYIVRKKAGYKKDGVLVRCRDVYDVKLWVDFNPFVSKRKSARWKSNDRYHHERVIDRIEPVGVQRVKCITVAAEDGSFLCTRDYIVTHNSSVQIRKAIHWSTEKKLWKKLWPHLVPNQFWYLYPTKDVATAEFWTKWKQFLPSDPDDPVYGYKIETERKLIKAVHFKSGVTIYFKTYKQDVQDLQSGSCFAVFCDEELPIELLGELQARLNATDGYFHLVFTATLGQDYWRRAIEPNEGEKEEHTNALKIQASLYDCLEYEDGTPSHWTRERIQRIEAKCPTYQDIQVRVHGKFAKVGGRRYESYDEALNRAEPHPLPTTWHVYSGVDIGSGGEKGHPAAIVFVAVDPLYRRGRVFRAWRGDGVSTTSGDILVKYLELRGDLKPVMQVYDYASAEFRQMAERAGESFERADKKIENGERILNTLFKHQMLAIQHGDPELDKLSGELSTLMSSTRKNEAVDHLIDALRYTCSQIPWDFASLEGMPVKALPNSREYTEEDRRRGLEPLESSDIQLVDMEIAEWNEHYGS